MFTQRMTAYKVMIKDVINGEYVEQEGSPDYMIIKGEKIGRVRVLGTIVNKFIAEEKEYGFLIIDDGTETIRARGFNEKLSMIKNSELGDLVDIIGRLRKWEQEVYVIPEAIVKVSPNFEILRKLELMKQSKRSGKEKLSETKEKSSFKEEIEEETIKEEVKKEVKKEVMSKGKVLSLISENTQGIMLNEIIRKSGLDKEACIEILNELMKDGSVFEPKPGKFKALD